jgi:glycosyltransferase involved in cell wall biosynthesis
MTPKLIGIGWQVGVPSGWGVYGVNLALELAKREVTPEIYLVQSQIALTEDQAAILAPHLARQPKNFAAFNNRTVALDGPMLRCMGDQLDLPDELAALRGAPDIGVVFFESAVIPQANIEKAKELAGIVAGSTWNAEILRRHGLIAVQTCLQGVDLSLFRPGPRQGRFPGRFVVFSGGKLEYRKGQDLVVMAFKRFHARHPDALLVAAWQNPWPQAAKSLAMSTHTKGSPAVSPNGQLDVTGWLMGNDLSPASFVDLGRLHNAQTSALLNEVDVALLPSRCEGGTNLVAMECMAAGVPVILSRNTGHLDLMAPDNCYPLNMQLPIGALTGRQELADWGESSIEEIVAQLEAAYTDSAVRRARGAAATQFMQDWSWANQVGKLVDAVAGFS